MDIETALRGRRTVHSYQPGVIPEDVLHEAFSLAILAPNHRLTWPWRFLRVGSTTRNDLVPLMVRAQSKGGPVTEGLVEKVRQKLFTPGELIVVSQKLHSDEKTRREDYAACACAIQNLTLALFARGFGTKWGTGAVTTWPETYALLSIDSELEEILGFIYAGVPLGTSTTPERPAVETFVRQLP